MRKKTKKKNSFPPAIHPGEHLSEELEELGLSARSFAKALSIPTNRVTQILRGQRGVTADTALRLARYFGMSPDFWLNLQKTYELRKAQKELGKKIIQEVEPYAA